LNRSLHCSVGWFPSNSFIRIFIIVIIIMAYSWLLTVVAILAMTNSAQAACNCTSTGSGVEFCSCIGKIGHIVEFEFTFTVQQGPPAQIGNASICYHKSHKWHCALHEAKMLPVDQAKFCVPHLLVCSNLCIQIENVTDSDSGVCGCFHLAAKCIVDIDLKVGCFHVGDNCTIPDAYSKPQLPWNMPFADEIEALKASGVSLEEIADLQNESVVDEQTIRNDPHIYYKN
jgi:hypothetical protein